ncbi:MAG: helix-turn-helix transcriptional regulator [Bacteroidia bacterium]|jgi:transcriptional regulator with XRE-family HTH domain|nr:helix-turn-helix transcriptional regulator [Bacteroidia bacterium]
MLTEIELFVINKVREFRTEKKVSQAELSDRIGVSFGFIGKIESLKYNSKYNLNHINKISKALGISPKDLLPKESL